MEYFKYKNSKQMGRVWTMFSELGTMSEKLADADNHFLNYEHTVDIVEKAIKGSMYDMDDFDLSAYEYGCVKNDMLEKIGEVKRKLNIVEESDKEDERVGFGDISERRLSHKERGYDRILDNGSFDQSLEYLLGIRKAIIISDGVDIITALKASLKGDDNSVNVIKILSKKNKDIEEAIEILCSRESGILLNSLSRVA